MRFSNLIFGIFIALLVGAAVLGCESKDVDCDIAQNATSFISNSTPRTLQVLLCPSNQSSKINEQTIPSASDFRTYSTRVGSRKQTIKAPYADSHGDACASTEMSAEDVATQAPILSSQDIANTKVCQNGNHYLFVDASQNCPVEYVVLDQSKIDCP